MQERWRQVVHLLFGCAIALSIAVFPPEWTLPFYAAALLIGSILTDAVERGRRVPIITPLLEELEREDSGPGRGAYYFVVSALACLVLFGPFRAGVGIFVLALLDSVATMAGMYLGRHRIYNNKSLEGFLVGTLFTAVLLLPFLSPERAVLVALFGGVIELLSPGDDNLVIPPAVCLVLALWS
ncbi:MAG TPA: phosphatidate cytidylyltransferase [Methanoregulaceae archaeon]|nr:phosphatidate cytidylyltransferase [Methanoregulaceae archaeon]HOV67203.1 phosphatidate cytidylyltransferase [Methanoregulaceae archaeon]HQJ87721.1 phosphatidate cytidylyltransferase [Methanoregulaceae archaeon]